MTIKVFGSCCSKCMTMYTYAEEIINEKKLNATLEKVSDLKTQMKYGIISLPALVIDEKVVAAGRMLSKKDMEKYICG